MGYAFPIMSKNTLKILVPRPTLSYRMIMHAKIVRQACNFKCSIQHIKISKGRDLNYFNVFFNTSCPNYYHFCMESTYNY